MKTEYTSGFQAGVRSERNYIEDFITHHIELPSNYYNPLSAQEILDEIRARDKKDIENRIVAARKGEWCDND
jgi:hypothetical protein